MPRYSNQKRTVRRRGLSKPQAVYLLLAALIIAAVIGGWLYHNRPSAKKAATIPSTTSTGSSAASQPAGSDQSAAGNPSSSPAAQPHSTPSAPKPTLISPWGDFVSNHFPGQNGSTTTETSTCNTTPGATCYIRFTNGSQTRTLASKVANGDGSVIWNWDVKTAGFTAGSWKIAAIATLNGQTKSAGDSLSLTVQ